VSVFILHRQQAYKYIAYDNLASFPCSDNADRLNLGMLLSGGMCLNALLFRLQILHENS
jgi:hypothetical protein